MAILASFGSARAPTLLSVAGAGGAAVVGGFAASAVGRADDLDTDEDRYAAMTRAIAGLDSLVHELTLYVAIVHNDRGIKFMRSGDLATLNCVVNAEHETYLRDKISYVRQVGDDVRISGYFLASTERVTRPQIKTDVMVDRSDVLAKIAADYVRDTVLAGAMPDVPVYVNISEKRNLQRLDVLKPVPGVHDRELALVELAKASLNVEKRCIYVKAYVGYVFY